MKKLVYVLLFLLLVGCANNNETGVLLRDNKNELKDSMKLYYDLDRKIYESNSFEVKVVDVIEVPYKLDFNDDFRIIYRYRIVIAPKYSKDIKLKSITFKSVDESINKYLSSPYPLGNGDLSGWNILAKEINFGTWRELSDFSAYELSFYMHNLTSNFQEESNISDEMLLSGMSNLIITVKYNNKVEHITLDNLEITKVNQEIIDSREDIRELTLEGTTYGSLSPYGSGLEVGK